MRISAHRIHRMVLSQRRPLDGTNTCWVADLDIETTDGEVLHVDLFAAGPDALTVCELPEGERYEAPGPDSESSLTLHV